jgi:hypothetical protein
MKDLWIEAYDEVLEGCEPFEEPPDDVVEALFQARLERLHDAADNARKADRERGLSGLGIGSKQSAAPSWLTGQ